MSEDPLALARQLRPTIIEARSDTEEQRRVAEPVIAELRNSGLSRLALQSDLGGLQADPVIALQVYEELAAAEASVGWIVWNCALPCLFGRHLSDDARAELLADPARMYASSTRATGKAAVVDDGFRVSGRWSLVSGCMHADTLCFMCLIEEDGEVKMVEGMGPALLIAYVPREACEIIDTWHVGGLRGTGSHDIALDGIFVPAANTCSPFDESHVGGVLGRIPTAATMSAGHAAICLGIARAALEEVCELGRTKVSVDPTPSLRDRPGNQRAVAEAAVKVDACRRQLHMALAALAAQAASDAEIGPETIADVWAAAVTTALECRGVVDRLYAVAGTSALYTDFALERGHRDIHAAAQHVVAQPLWLEQAGAVKLGLAPSNPLFAI